MNVTINPAGFPTPGLPNHGYKVWLAGVIMIISSGIFVGARVATRISQRQMGADDYAIIGALVSCIIQVSLWLTSVREGYGADYLMLNWPHQKLFNKYWYLGGLFFPITLGLFKTSVILLNKRIFIQEGFQKACWVVLIVNACWCIGNFLGAAFQCIPMDTMWGGTPPEEAVCWNQNGLCACAEATAMSVADQDLGISLVTWDISSDVVILTMPLPMIWALQLKTKEKIMLTGMILSTAWGRSHQLTYSPILKASSSSAQCK